MLGDQTKENGPEGILATYMVDLRIRLDNYPYFPGTEFGGGGGTMMSGHWFPPPFACTHDPGPG